MKDEEKILDLRQRTREFAHRRVKLCLNLPDTYLGNHITTGQAIISFFMVVFLLLPFSAHAGSLDSPAAPTDSGSAMYTLEDIYNRLNAGTTGTKRSGSFTGPSAGPGSTGYSFDEVMGKAPTVDDTNGASASDILSGKTYWGLTSGGWGAQTGTLATQTLSDASETVNAGYYNATTLSAEDSDLTAGNIAGGTVIFGITGTLYAPVEKSGQTASYSATGGEDGDLQKGVTWPSPRFTDNSNGTVTDNLTGLIWLQDASCTDVLGGVTFSGEELDWEEALTWSNAMADGSCGLTDSSAAGDWRLPNEKEFYSLIDFAFNGPPLSDAVGTGQWTDGDAFTGVQSDRYWSSTTHVGNTVNAWFMKLSNGASNYTTKTDDNYVWLVRGP